MSWQLLTVVNATKAGPAALLDLVTAAVAWDSATHINGIEFANDGRTFLFVSNATGAKDSTQAFQAITNEYGRTETNSPVVAFGDVGLMGPFAPHLWNTSEQRIRCIPDQTAEAAIKFVAIRIANPT